ncbi:helix-turn-helix domain-containing protein [Vallitalea sediminicola]
MFKKRLKKLRIDNHLTQEELGKKVNLKKAAISKYENGKNEPNIDVIIKLAKIFNVSVDYLAGKTDNFTPISDNITIKEIDKKLDHFIEEIAETNNLMFNGNPMDELTREVLLDMLITTKNMANKINQINK